MTDLKHTYKKKLSNQIGSQVANMRVVVDRRPTGIQPNKAGFERFKQTNPALIGIEKL